VIPAALTKFFFLATRIKRFPCGVTSEQPVMRPIGRKRRVEAQGVPGGPHIAFSGWRMDFDRPTRTSIVTFFCDLSPCTSRMPQPQNTKRNANCMKRGVVNVERYLPNCDGS